MFPTDLYTSPGPLRWLYVDFNSYFASVEQHLHPVLRGRAIAVVPVETDYTCVIAASYEAKAFGIRTGTPVHEAKRLCPDLVCLIARHNHYVEFHHRLIEEIGRHIPVTAVCSIDEMACRLMDNENTPERATAIGLSIKQGIAENISPHIRCSIGIAPNKYLAKVATDLNKPDGLTVLTAKDLPHRLLSLPLRDFPGIGANMERRLHAAGIRDMHRLMQLDTRSLRGAWGSVWGEKMWYLLRGIELPEESTDRRSIGHSQVLAPNLRPPAAARAVARRLTLKAASRLRRMGYYAAGMALSVRVDGGPRLAAEASCRKSQDNFIFLRLLDEMWQKLSLRFQGQRLKKVSIVFHHIVAAEDIQPDLFDALEKPGDVRRSRDEKISTAMDALNKKFGRDTVALGALPSQLRDFSGTKVAFNRIPDVEEFLE